LFGVFFKPAASIKASFHRSAGCVLLENPKRQAFPDFHLTLRLAYIGMRAFSTPILGSRSFVPSTSVFIAVSSCTSHRRTASFPGFLP